MSTGPSIRRELVTRPHPAGDISFPLIEVRGADGPVLAIVAGVHGCEFPGMEACRRLVAETDFSSLRGVLRVVPVANVPGFFGRSEVICPVDGKNLNRVFPGDSAGSYSEALAFHIMQEAVIGSDAVLDVHGGDIFEALVPYSGISHESEGDLHERSRELARVYGLPFVVTFDGHASAGTTLRDAAAANLGLPAVLHESGGQGLMNPDMIEAHLQGMRNTMRYMGMLPGDLNVRDSVDVLRSDFWRAQHAGMFYPLVALGSEVKEGQLVGLVRDLLGDVIEEIVAPRDAWIIAIVTCFSCRENGIVYQVAY